MSQSASRGPVQAGETAPDFKLPAVHAEGTVSLADYRGRSPLLLAIFRGLYCPFCRRAVAQFGGLNDKLRQAGVESLAVVATELDNARLYFKYRPAKVPIVADPELLTHRAYGLPQPPVDEKVMQALQTTMVNPTGELREPTALGSAAEALNKVHGYEMNATDARDVGKQGVQLKGQFLLDRDGIVRWANIECASEGLAGFGKFPTENELMAAVRALG